MWSIFRACIDEHHRLVWSTNRCAWSKGVRSKNLLNTFILSTTSVHSSIKPISILVRLEIWSMRSMTGLKRAPGLMRLTCEFALYSSLVQHISVYVRLLGRWRRLEGTARFPECMSPTHAANAHRFAMECRAFLSELRMQASSRTVSEFSVDSFPHKMLSHLDLRNFGLSSLSLR